MSGPHGVTRLVVTVPGVPPHELSPNGRRRIHPLREAGLTREWRRIGTYAALGQRQTCGGGPLFAGPVRLTERVVWGKGRRATDLSAVPTLCKALEDALQDAGIIGDDAQVVELVVLAHGKDRGGPGWVELVIEEVAP